MSVAYGMLPGGTVGDALTRVLMRSCAQGWVAVVRSIDSSSSMDDLVRILAFHCIAYEVVHGNVCLSMSDLQKALDAGVFTGFDEVWIISGRPPAMELSQLPSTTSDGTEFSRGMPEGLPTAMEKMNCILIVGDGCGLNYATSNEYIREAIMERDKENKGA